MVHFDSPGDIYGSGSGQIKLFFSCVEINHGSSFITIEDLDLRETSNACILSWANYVTVRGLNIQDVIGIGAYITNKSSNLAVIDNTITRTGNGNLYFINDNGPYRDCVVRGNDISRRTTNILGYSIDSTENATAYANVDGLLIEGNYIHDNDKGAMDWYWSNNVTVRHNYLYNNPGGMGAAHGTNFRVHDNILVATSANASRGILIWPKGDSTSYIYNNVFYGLRHNGGITCWDAAYNVHTFIFNNIIHIMPDTPVNSTSYLSYANAAQVSSFNNCFYGWATPRWLVNGIAYSTFTNYVAAGIEKHSLNVDPLFVSTTPVTAADFMLQANSPCINTGVHPKVVGAIEPSGMVNDYDGVFRHLGGGVDIGAFEATGTGTSTLSNGLVLSVHFDEPGIVANRPTIVDATGNNYHGTPVSGVATATNGKLDGAIDLNGVDGYASFGKLGNWNPTEFTLSFWFKDMGNGGIHTALFNDKFTVYYNGSRRLQLMRWGSLGYSYVLPPALTEGVWYHVVCTYSDSGDRKAHMYINNTHYVGANAVSGTMTDCSNYTFRLGDNYSGNDPYPKAQFDEVNVWNRVLTANEITSLYNAGNGLVANEPDTYPILDASSPNFQRVPITPYGPGSSATVTPEDRGATLRMTGDGWVKIPYAYSITAKTVLSFDYRTSSVGDIHAIGMDNDNTLDAGKTFQIDGVAAYGIADFAYDYFFVESGWRHYEIPIGAYYTGAMQNICFGNKAASGSPECEFSNIVVRERLNSATALSPDTSTQGTWKSYQYYFGGYGADGYDIRGASASLPSYATLSYLDGADLTWAASTTDVRALQKPNSTTDRIASCRYSATTETIDLTINGGVAKNVAIYVVDWDRQGRSMTVEAIDGDSGAVLNTQSVSSFADGTYLKYRVTGHIRFRFIKTAGDNAVVSGVFFQ